VKKALKFGLKPLSDRDAELLNKLIEEYNALIRRLLLVVRYSRLYLNPSRERLHALTYHWLRREVGLHSNHITSARDRAVEMVLASSYYKTFPNPGEVPVRLFRGKTYYVDGSVVKIVVEPGIYAYGKLLGDEEWLNVLDSVKGAS